MKKKIVSAVALTMALGMTLGVVGCNQNPPTAKSEQEMYQAVTNGFDAYVAHNGATTVTLNSTYTEDGGTEKDVEVSVMKFSIDPTAKKMYMTETATYTEYEGTEKTDEETETMVSKLYKEGETFYSYTKEDEDEAQYMSFSESYLDMVLSGDMISGMMDVDVGSLESYLGGADFAAVKSAYESVYSEQLTAIKLVDENATATANVTVREQDGAFEFKVATETKNNMDLGGVMGDVNTQQIVSFTAKDGKLSQVYFKMYGGMSAVVGTETMTEGFGMETTMDISYTFDETGYNAITTQTPTEGVEAMPDIKMINIDLKIGDYTETVSTMIPTVMTAEYAVNNIINNYLGGTYGKEITLYTDSAKTTKLDVTNMTLDQFCALETLYVDVAPQDGYALFIMVDETIDNKSEAYKIVFGNQTEVEFNGINVDWFDTNVGATNEHHVYAYNGETVYVNGTALAEGVESFAYEAGETYIIRRVRTITNAEFNIFMPDF
jgi:hypothetical protein